jgi:hypothetical protein
MRLVITPRSGPVLFQDMTRDEAVALRNQINAALEIRVCPSWGELTGTGQPCAFSAEVRAEYDRTHPMGKVVQSSSFPLDETTDEVQEGERSKTVARVANHLLRHYVDEWMTLGLCQDFNRSHCSPPFGEEEVIELVTGMARRELTRRANV